MISSVSPIMFPRLITLIAVMAAVLTPTATSFPRSGFNLKRFHQCINNRPDPPNPSSGFWPATDPTFPSVLNSTAENTKCLDPDIPKPVLIVTPYTEAEVQTIVVCARLQNVNLRLRSGAHDYECLSYASFTGEPFVVLDLQNLRNITVNLVDQTAWVQAGTTLGEFYYHISNASNGALGFPAGLCTTIGVAGMMLRQYGLAADNLVDARLVSADGQILNRKSMVEDLFWAISGGAGGSFGVLLAWKVQLVRVPTKVTVFTSVKTLEQQGIDLLYKWQTVAPTTDPRLFMRVLLQTFSPSPGYETVMTLYNSMFLGNKSDLLSLMDHSFPELNLTDHDCHEVSWIEAVVYIAGYPAGTKPDYLLRRKPTFINDFKAKSDYIKTAISKDGLQGLCNAVMKNNRSVVVFTPYGGKMAHISPYSTPFPHRGALYMAHYVAQWSQTDKWAETRAMNEKWVRDLYAYMAHFVSMNPREAYANYRDLDLGRDEHKCWNCSCPYKWGPSYFGHNFWRLVAVKSMVDSSNFFNNEQSIPTNYTLHRCIKLVS